MKLFHISALLLALAITSVRAADEKKADNTERNQKDRDGTTKTPPDQSNNPEDVKLTQSIRQAVVKDKSLSMTAKNVKIITIDGKVTLRGPVKTDDEKKTIDKLAKVSAGDTKVTNEIEVKN